MIQRVNATRAAEGWDRSLDPHMPSRVRLNGGRESV